MDTNSLKQSVVKSYSALAKSRKNETLANLFGCCSVTKHADTIAENIGYSKEILDQVPENSNLGVGCGNPAALATIEQGATVVDLGSGAGFDAFIVSRIVGEQGKVIGVDLSEDMLKLARKNAKKAQYVNVDFIKGDIESLPLKDKIADHIISNCVINLSLNKDQVYREAYRVLKPGGKIAVSDIVLQSELPDYIKNSLVGHVACVSGAEKLEDYLGYIEEAGFTDIKIESKSNFPLELMLSDPQIMQIAQKMDFDLDSQEAKAMAAKVVSVSITATKREYEEL